MLRPVLARDPVNRVLSVANVVGTIASTPRH
jgi:hypothetical protein